MRIEIITQANCPKCDHLKRILTYPTVRMKDIQFNDIAQYPKSLLDDYLIIRTPTIMVWNDEGALEIIEKGMTLKNISKRIKAHTGIEIRNIY